MEWFAAAIGGSLICLALGCIAASDLRRQRSLAAQSVRRRRVAWMVRLVERVRAIVPVLEEQARSRIAGNGETPPEGSTRHESLLDSFGKPHPECRHGLELLSELNELARKSPASFSTAVQRLVRSPLPGATVEAQRTVATR